MAVKLSGHKITSCDTNTPGAPVWTNFHILKKRAKALCDNIFWHLSALLFCFSDTFRTSARSRQMWAKPEPGFASLWRRSCFLDTWSSCFQTTSWQSEKNSLTYTSSINSLQPWGSIFSYLFYFVILPLSICLCRNVRLIWNEDDMLGAHL